jgi:hypothetical protein
MTAVTAASHGGRGPDGLAVTAVTVVTCAAAMTAEADRDPAAFPGWEQLASRAESLSLG